MRSAASSRSNPAWKRLLGYTDDNLKHLNLFDVVAPEDAAIVEGLLLRLDSRRAGRHLRRHHALQGRPPRRARGQCQRAHPGRRAARDARHLPRRHAAQAGGRPLAIVRERLGLALRGSSWRCGISTSRPAACSSAKTGAPSRHRAARHRRPDGVADRARHPDDLPGNGGRLCGVQGRAPRIPGGTPRADRRRTLEVDLVARHGHRTHRERARQADDRHQRRHRRAQARRGGDGRRRAAVCARSPTDCRAPCISSSGPAAAACGSTS